MHVDQVAAITDVRERDRLEALRKRTFGRAYRADRWARDAPLLGSALAVTSLTVWVAINR